MGRRSRGFWVGLVVALLVGTSACSTPVAGAPSSSAGATTEAEAEADAGSEETSALPPGAESGFDDLNDDGEPDPTCGRQDYGGGLVLRIPCNIADYSRTPTADTTLVPNSLYGFPGPELDLTGVSGEAVQARNAAGQLVVVFFINSDTLFDVGSATLGDPARVSFEALVRLVQANWPTAPIQVRGHTDSTGGTAANQTLSERRATAALDFFATNGIDRARLTSIGFGSTIPIVLETNTDGSVNESGRQYNRRVEFAVTVP